MALLSTVRRNTEHWMTTMTCSACEMIPEVTPLYQCNMGHVVCVNCFRKLKRGGVPRCRICNSTDFKSFSVSADFLQKLKNKPGIGRSRRFPSEESLPISTHSENRQEIIDEIVQLEKIFSLPFEKLDILFTKRGLLESEESNFNNEERSIAEAKLRSYFACRSQIRQDEVLRSSHFVKAEKIIDSQDNRDLPLKNVISMVNSSRKPLRCPHDCCGKIIAVSSFISHFNHEHPNILKRHVSRGKEFYLPLDVSIIEFSRTVCLAILSVDEATPINVTSPATPAVANVVQKFNAKVPIGSFWILVSGSPEDNLKNSYVLYWVFTNSKEEFKCTIEVSSAKESVSYSTFCSTNGMHESQSIRQVAKRLNCLYLTYGAFRSLLEEGPMLNLRVTVH